MEETDRAEGAGLMEVSDQEESEWELFKLSVKINTELMTQAYYSYQA